MNSFAGYYLAIKIYAEIEVESAKKLFDSQVHAANFINL